MQRREGRAQVFFWPTMAVEAALTTKRNTFRTVMLAAMTTTLIWDDACGAEDSRCWVL
ncbi:hypothetical protein A2U01_0025725 [Trifolium medium]|uniref:Uncharacterized protein n=1 Tax=Trifolium medium TaxID=97028 RepID=A0A392NY12_9FABA|nr:hypothetical protein [Trifolium medium]